MTAGSHPPQRSISFQDTSYGRRSFGRPKSGNIAVLSPHPPVIGPHAPADRAVVILGFPDRGSPDLAASVVVLRREGLNANLYYRWSKEFLEAGKKRLVGDTTREARRMVHGPLVHHARGPAHGSPVRHSSACNPFIRRTKASIEQPEAPAARSSTAHEDELVVSQGAGGRQRHVVGGPLPVQFPNGYRAQLQRRLPWGMARRSSGPPRGAVTRRLRLGRRP